LDLLNESSNDFEVFVANGPNADKVYVHYAHDVSSCQSSMLLSKVLITSSRDNELVLTRLTAVGMIIGVEERSVADHYWHLKPLVHDLEISILVNWRDIYLVVIFG